MNDYVIVFMVVCIAICAEAIGYIRGYRAATARGLDELERLGSHAKRLIHERKD